MRPTSRPAVLPITGVLSVLLLGCGGPSPATPSDSNTTPALPTSYDFTLASTCGERSLIGNYRVSVRDGQVSRATSLDRDRRSYEPELADVPTLQDILDLARDQSDAVTEFDVDKAGVPRFISLDPELDAIDDEECYKVSDYRVDP